MTHNCRKCGSQFEPRLRNINRGDWICPPCYRQSEFERRAKRKAEGRPIRSGTYTLEERRAWAKTPENRFKNAARARTRYALRTGKLSRKPCEVCGALPAEVHHEDYRDHLAIRWLCKTHHEAHHRIEARGETL